ncbi:MAG: DUF4136 domain-containing protein [Cyclobacteriaceae bacterium]|nr:DUF4136 domain-containing protein [Cyclobacteriaceae bacterium]
MNKVLAVIALSAITMACENQPQTADLVRFMAVQTQYDQSDINSTENIFKTYSTFIIRNDTIGYVSSSPNSDTILVDGINIDVPNGYVTPVVNLIKLKLSEAGFDQVSDSDNPDFAVNVAVLQNFSFFQTINYPGYYSGYYGYYNYYYPIVTTYYANYATLVIEIVDVKNFAANNNKYKVIWKASIGDLISTVDLRGKTLEAIEQAFQQSPYIKKN